MKYLKEIKWQSMIYSIFYIVIGIVLLLFPETTAATICYVAGSFGITGGIIMVGIYLFRDAGKNAYRNDFVGGLLAILIGIFVICRVELVLGLIPFILGIAIMVSGFIKLQSCIDIRKMSYGDGLILFILALVNVVWGIILIINPFKTSIVLFVLIGIGLVFSGISDIFANLYLSKKTKSYLNASHLPESSEKTSQDNEETKEKVECTKEDKEER